MAQVCAGQVHNFSQTQPQKRRETTHFDALDFLRADLRPAYSEHSRVKPCGKPEAIADPGLLGSPLGRSRLEPYILNGFWLSLGGLTRILRPARVFTVPRRSSKLGLGPGQANDMAGGASHGSIKPIA